MELKEAVAGTLESGDMLVRIGPGEGLQLELQSSVEAQFGRRIRAVIRETLEGLGVENATVRVAMTMMTLTSLWMISAS